MSMPAPSKQRAGMHNDNTLATELGVPPSFSLRAVVEEMKMPDCIGMKSA